MVPCKRHLRALPFHSAHLCQFLENQGEDKAASTVQRRLYAIRKVRRLLKRLNLHL